MLDPSSGILQVAALALVEPWAEEIMLRGVVYGALERRGGALLAILGSAGVFSLLHAAQHIGNLGPWAVVSLTGLILSCVRWWSGSVLGSVVAHLVYNALLLAPIFAVG